MQNESSFKKKSLLFLLISLLFVVIVYFSGLWIFQDLIQKHALGYPFVFESSAESLLISAEGENFSAEWTLLKKENGVFQKKLFLPFGKFELKISEKEDSEWILKDKQEIRFFNYAKGLAVFKHLLLWLISVAFSGIGLYFLIRLLQTMEMKVFAKFSLTVLFLLLFSNLTFIFHSIRQENLDSLRNMETTADWMDILMQNQPDASELPEDEIKFKNEELPLFTMAAFFYCDENLEIQNAWTNSTIDADFLENLSPDESKEITNFVLANHQTESFHKHFPTRGYYTVLRKIPVNENSRFGIYIYSKRKIFEGLRWLLFSEFTLLIFVSIIMITGSLEFGQKISFYLESLLSWTKQIIRGNFEIEESFESKDEFGALAENFHEMRKTLGAHVNYLDMMNRMTAFMQGFTRKEELYRVFLSCITGSFGMSYNRAALFLLDESGNLCGRYAVGMMDEEEIKERFGSVQDYFNCNIELSDFISLYEKDKGFDQTRFLGLVREICADPYTPSFLWDVFNRKAVLYISAREQFLRESDKNFRDKLNLSECVFMPINQGTRTIGVLMVDNLFHQRKIMQKSIDELQIFNNQFSGNLQNADMIENLEKLVEQRTDELKTALEDLEAKERVIKMDLAISQRIQTALLPKSVGDFEHFSASAYYKPMSEVGGDFYDLTEIKSDVYRVFIADATGHGVQGALITMLIKSEYEKLKYIISRPEDLLSRLNNSYIKSYENLSFFFTCIVLDINFKNNSISYASGGHPSQFLLSEKGLKELPPTGKIMGIIEDENFNRREFDFQSGDGLVLFTDGLFEQFNADQEEFSDKRLLELANENAHRNAQDLSEILLHAVFEFSEGTPVNDDITLLSISLD